MWQVVPKFVLYISMAYGYMDGQNSLSGLVSQNSSDLIEMVPVVASHVTGQVADTDFAPLSMYAEAVPLIHGKSSQHAQIGFAEQTEHFQGLFGPPGGVVAEPGPKILVETRQIYPAMLKHLAIAPRTREFIFGKMRENLAHRPLAGRRAGCEACPRNPSNSFREGGISLLF
jgi:hypothetical protein